MRFCCFYLVFAGFTLVCDENAKKYWQTITMNNNLNEDLNGCLGDVCILSRPFYTHTQTRMYYVIQWTNILTRPRNMYLFFLTWLISLITPPLSVDTNLFHFPDMTSFLIILFCKKRKLVHTPQKKNNNIYTLTTHKGWLRISGNII